MIQYPEPLAKLIESYTKLPGIGQKTATRLAFYTLSMQEDDVTNFAKSLLSAKRDLHNCSICGNITEDDPCPICRDKTRDHSQILVVEQSQDVMGKDGCMNIMVYTMSFMELFLQLQEQAQKILILQVYLND